MNKDINKICILLSMAVSASFAAKIGVLKADPNVVCSEEIVINLDVEDSNNDTKILSGDGNLPAGVTLGSHAIFTYCTINAVSLKPAPYNYAVLRLGSKCPSGSYPFARHHDTEDSRNANSFSGNIAPSIVNSNATLEYCLVPSSEKSKIVFPFDDKYGVFGNPPEKYDNVISHNLIKIDDEDNHSKTTEYVCEVNPLPNKEPHEWPESCYDRVVGAGHNGNYWNYYDELYNTGAAAREKRIARFNDVMYGDDNTFYHVIKKKKNVLAKASTIEGSNALANFAENPVAAAEIKGINRNAVSIELKSAGNANISIMNIDGVVVAKISKENLQQGVYNIKWNSESIPNGRYIVAVKHNGLFSAKNVILK